MGEDSGIPGRGNEMPWLIAAAVVLIAVISLHIIWRARWGPPARFFPRVLAYHKVTGFEFGGTWVPKERFVSQLDYLLDSGYRFIDEDTFLQTVSGKRQPGGMEILLTFDDGYSMLVENAVPALEDRNIPALIFLVTSYVGRENTWELQLPGRKFTHMGWDEILDLSTRGFSFGSHTRSHRNLTKLPMKNLRTELSISREVIENATGCRVRTLSYPFGRCNAVVRSEAETAGYEAAFTLYPGGRNSRIEPFELRREGVWVIDTNWCISTKLADGGLFWAEDLKGRAINGVAGLTPLFMKKTPFDI